MIMVVSKLVGFLLLCMQLGSVQATIFEPVGGVTKRASGESSICLLAVTGMHVVKMVGLLVVVVVVGVVVWVVVGVVVGLVVVLVVVLIVVVVGVWSHSHSTCVVHWQVQKV